jgi:hypothetical protein
MTSSITVHSISPDSAHCGGEIGQKIREAFGSDAPDVVIVFASARHDHAKLLAGIEASCRPGILVGCSSAGEFVTRSYEVGSVSALAIRSSDIVFNAVVGRGLRTDRTAAARSMVESFEGLSSNEFAYRSALVLTDALAGHADDFVEQLTLLTAGKYQLFGGGAGDDAAFRRTHVFYGAEAIPDAAVALEILSDKPIGVGVQHTWTPGSDAFRVTESDGMRLVSMNNTTAIEIFAAHAQRTGQTLDPKNPGAFFLHNVLGIATAAGFRLRVPLAVHEDGSVQCAADIPQGATVHIMSPKGGSAVLATQRALEQLEGHEPGVALFFDCVATRLRMGGEFGFELESVRQALGDVSYAGCNTYGQIARSDGQFNGFHNCTAVVAVFPK